ncbi:hypothetical protein Bbelb_036170 [Branchiostoma belcheri]|nr:hypothetical protein Bbelb_036170 [Branchiostoma belcheri]
MGDVRAVLKGVPFMALTATATKDVQEVAVKKLNLKKTKVVKGSLDRRNIFLVCKKVSTMKVADAGSTEDEYGFGETCDDCGFRIFVSPEDLDETHRNIRETLDHNPTTTTTHGSRASRYLPTRGLSLPGTVSTLGSTVRSSNSTATMERKEYQSKKCRVHGVDAPLKGHKGICPWQHCACNDCEQVSSYRRQHVMDGRERTAPKEMTACDVIDIANMTREDSGTTSSAAKGAQKQQARGVKNTKIYEARNRRSLWKRLQYTQHSTCAGQSGTFPPHRQHPKSRPSTSRDDRPSTSRDDRPSTSRDDRPSTSRDDRPSTSRDDRGSLPLVVWITSLHRGWEPCPREGHAHVRVPGGDPLGPLGRFPDDPLQLADGSVDQRASVRTYINFLFRRDGCTCRNSQRTPWPVTATGVPTRSQAFPTSHMFSITKRMNELITLASPNHQPYGQRLFPTSESGSSGTDDPPTFRHPQKRELDPKHTSSSNTAMKKRPRPEDLNMSDSAPRLRALFVTHAMAAPQFRLPPVRRGTGAARPVPGDPPESIVPDQIMGGDRHTRSDWLHSRAAEIVDIAFQDEAAAINRIVEGIESYRFKCRQEGCNKSYVRPRGRELHEQSKHNLHVPSSQSSEKSTEDGVANYQAAKLSMALLIKNLKDATREGDGERVARCLKMALLFFRAYYGHSKYTLSTFLFFVRVEALLPAGGESEDASASGQDLSVVLFPCSTPDVAGGESEDASGQDLSGVLFSCSTPDVAGGESEDASASGQDLSGVLFPCSTSDVAGGESEDARGQDLRRDIPVPRWPNKTNTYTLRRHRYT